MGVGSVCGIEVATLRRLVRENGVLNKDKKLAVGIAQEGTVERGDGGAEVLEELVVLVVAPGDADGDFDGESSERSVVDAAGAARSTPIS